MADAIEIIPSPDSGGRGEPWRAVPRVVGNRGFPPPQRSAESRPRSSPETDGHVADLPASAHREGAFRRGETGATLGTGGPLSSPPEEDEMGHIDGSHHATLCVGAAQEDVDFHTGLLGLRFIKKTVLYDGSLPIYHLYYSNADGDASSVVTTFPFLQAGVIGRRGTNQARELQLAVPSGSLDFWSGRLAGRSIDVDDVEVLGRRRLLFRHPCGIEYALVGVDGDTRTGFAGDDVPPEHAVHGIHGVGVHVANPENMVEFVDRSFYGKLVAEEGDRVTCRSAGRAGAARSSSS